jgi:hypothetical protein
MVFCFYGMYCTVGRSAGFHSKNPKEKRKRIDSAPRERRPETMYYFKMGISSSFSNFFVSEKHAAGLPLHMNENVRQ